MKSNNQNFPGNNDVTVNYWKCSCGKINSNHYELCIKCGKERPLLCTMQTVSYHKSHGGVK